jgi:hypothetical protein
VSDLALNGHDIMKLFDLKSGPVVGKIIDFLMEAVLDNPENNTYEALRSLAQGYYSQSINRADDMDDNEAEDNKTNHAAGKGS